MPTPAGKPPLSEATAEFGRRVRVRRNELGLSQEALAEACGLHWTFVGQVERGRRNLTLHNIIKIAHGLRVDAGELVSELKHLGGTLPSTLRCRRRHSGSLGWHHGPGQRRHRREEQLV